MKYLTLIILFVINLSFSQDTDISYVELDTIWIKPGIGINTIELEKTTEKEINKYQNWGFKKKNSQGIACGIGPSSFSNRTDYTSDSLGLRLKFITNWEEDREKLKNLSKKLIAVYIRQNENACLKNGICIGKSSFEEIIEIMKETKYKRDNYLGYPKKGISFYFNNDGKVFSIEIYKPK